MSATARERALIRGAVVIMRARIMAIVFGVVVGTGVWIATVWLLIQDGPDLGAHLGLLWNYMPGYRVSWRGAFIGLFWGAIYGAVIGWVFAWVYNQVVERRAPN